MRLWIDLDNSPHVHFFAPLISALQSQGHQVSITARRFGQVEDLARNYTLDVRIVGEHNTPKTFAGRASAQVGRALKLAASMRGQQCDAAVNHGSRAHVLAAWMLRIPVMTIYDYEFVSSGLFSKLATKVLLPEGIPSDVLAAQGMDMGKLIRYPGFKENVYLSGYQPSDAVLGELKLDRSRPIISVRPPATWAHYHSAHSETLFTALITRLKAEPEAQVVILPRTNQQGEDLQREMDLKPPQFLIPPRAVDALGLMAWSDAVFSGGGTMIRESAVIGSPSYSIFAGKPGAIDAALEKAGRLTILRTPEEVASLKLTKRDAARRIRPRH